MKINTGIITIEESDFKRIKLFLENIRNNSTLFINYQSEYFISGLIRLCNYILNDQIKNGLGKNGWAISDKKYMSDLYGKKNVKDFNDSLMTSVVVSLALNKFYKEFKKKDCLSDELVKHLENIINKSIITYFDEHWTLTTGSGGTYTRDRENNIRIVPTYRHSSWLLLIWLEFPIFYNRVEKSIKYLLDDFENIDWKKEKVATEIATFKAFNAIKQLDEFNSFIKNSKIDLYLKSLENSIVVKYNENIEGWTSGINIKRGRQIYTLFVLAELANYFGDKTRKFNECIQSAWINSINGEWDILKAGSEFDFQSESPDINLLSLSFSSIQRRNKLSSKEEDLRRKIYSLIMERLNSNDIGKPYSWALSYFLYDISVQVGNLN